MTPFRFLWLKNGMLVGNLLANLVGLALVGFILAPPYGGVSVRAWELMEQKGWLFDPLVFVLLVLVTRVYEIPVRQVIHLRSQGLEEPAHLLARARRRMLNEPFFLMAANLCLWVVAYLFYAAVLIRSGLGLPELGGGFLRSLFASLVTVIFAFFALQSIQQRWLSPFFFPEGLIHKTAGALRIRISTRLTAMLFACNIVPFTGLLHMLHAGSGGAQDQAAASSPLVPLLTLDIAIFMGMGIWVTVLVTRNFTRPLRSITKVLRGIQLGNLDERVRVTTNDEIGYSGDMINEMAAGLKERDFIKDTFGKYVSEEVRDEILSGRIPLDGEAREVTVLFADLRNFTPMVESTPPKEVVRVINRYFQEMEEAIQHHHGLVLQYIGDEIEAVFGAPVPRDGHPADAVGAALEMRGRLERLNEVLTEEGHPTLSHGIGIHTGRVVAANIGSASRVSYALVGDTVNLASRLQGLTRDLGTDIILSRATREGLNGEIPLRPLPPTRVKGKREIVEIFELSGPGSHRA